MKWICFLLCFWGVSLSICAQYETIWAFGKKAGMDFSSGIAKPIYTSIDSHEGCASICSITGQLLFYTDGYRIWNKNGTIMPNGDQLTKSSINNTFSTSQSSLIIPIPNNQDRYYVFSLTSYEEEVEVGKLFYSVVNMSLDGGRGDVEVNYKSILLDSNLTERMTAVVGDHCNIWLIVCTRVSAFKSFEISNSGISISPVVSNVGLSSFYSFGCLSVSPNRQKIILTRSGGLVPFWKNGAELYDFDASNGKVSNPKVLDLNSGYYSASFSPDNTKLYCTGGSSINSKGVYQFDLQSNNESEMLRSKYLVTSSSPNFTPIKLAPDGKLYFTGTSTDYLSIIKEPNLKGMNCQYDENAIHLATGSKIYLGLPNIIPIYKSDTSYTQKSITTECFSSIYLLDIDTNLNTWGYEWNTRASGRKLGVDSPGIYWVKYYSVPCTFHVDSFFVTFPLGTLPKIGIKNSCYNMADGKAWAYTYSGDTVRYYYSWRDSANNLLSTTDTLQGVPSGPYTLQITTAQCDTTLSIVIPEEKHRLSFETDTLACMGEEILFHNTSDPYFTHFNWNFGDSTSSILFQPSHPYDAPGTYRIMLSGSGAVCSDTLFQTVTVDPRVWPTFHNTPDSVCIGSIIHFYPESHNHTLLEQRWMFGDGTERMSNNDKEFIHAYDRASSVSVVLNSRFRVCPDTSFSRNLYIADLPKVNLQYDTVICRFGAPITLSNRVLPPAFGNYHYLWSTGDTMATLKVTHPGIYSLTLSQDPLGCSATESITINKNCYLDIPNAFTPNGDGENDYFFPRQLLSKGLINFTLQVWNRRGQLIFETQNTEGRGWDGRWNDKEQPVGVYVYLITAEINETEKEHYQGNISLLR